MQAQTLIPKLTYSDQRVLSYLAPHQRESVTSHHHVRPGFVKEHPRPLLASLTLGLQWFRVQGLGHTIWEFPKIRGTLFWGPYDK